MLFIRREVCPSDVTAPAGLVTEVAQGSVAESAGIKPGDLIDSINGKPLRDVLDYQFYSSDGVISVVVRRRSETTEIRFGELWCNLGIRFADPTFDGVHRCCNGCAFCFIHQNPPNMRPSLYIKDDDYRYSVLYGSFVTLTNLTETDWARIAEQRLSPLYVSVHCTDPDVRARMLSNPDAPDIREQLRRLAHLRIQVHAQVVLCPGLNDGDYLQQTVSDLAELHPAVQSLSIVPVGLAENGTRQVVGIRRPTSEEARLLVHELRRHQMDFRRRLGVSFVHLADEFYLISGLSVPASRYYDGYPQYNNGVGMVRSLLNEWDGLRRRRSLPRSHIGSATVVCGKMAEPVLARLIEDLGARLGVELRLLSVENQFYGPSVTVSGLLTGSDLSAGLAGKDLGEMVVAPEQMLDIDRKHFLDDVTPAELEAILGVPVVFAGDLRQLIEAVENGFDH